MATGLVQMPESELNDAADQLLLELENDLLLCPRRRGPWSLEDVHRSLLGGGGWMDPLHWPEGVPVICGGNQPELGLANGDLGVKLGSGEQSRVLFRVMAADGQPQIRRLHPARRRRPEASDGELRRPRDGAHQVAAALDPPGRAVHLGLQSVGAVY